MFGSIGAVIGIYGGWEIALGLIVFFYLWQKFIVPRIFADRADQNSEKIPEQEKPSIEERKMKLRTDLERMRDHQ